MLYFFCYHSRTYYNCNEFQNQSHFKCHLIVIPIRYQYFNKFVKLYTLEVKFIFFISYDMQIIYHTIALVTTTVNVIFFLGHTSRLYSCPLVRSTRISRCHLYWLAKLHIYKYLYVFYHFRCANVKIIFQHSGPLLQHITPQFSHQPKQKLKKKKTNK